MRSTGETLILKGLVGYTEEGRLCDSVCRPIPVQTPLVLVVPRTRDRVWRKFSMSGIIADSSLVVYPRRYFQYYGA